MKSLTKATVTKKQIENAVIKFFGSKPKDYTELNDGFYNISYLVTLLDNKEVVMKIAPPDDVEILTYEKEIIETELQFYKLAKKHTDIKVPTVLGEDFSGEIIASPYYFMSKIEGKALNKIGDISKDMRKQVYITIAEYLAKLHSIKGETYGYITMADKCIGKGCHNSLMVSLDALIYDAHRKGMELPFEESEIYKVFNSTKWAFNEIEFPVVCHYDLWDGNIFVKDSKNGLEVTGIIDFERGFYACPAADFSQVVGYIDIEKDDYFLETYNKFADKKIYFNSAFKTRVLAYRLYVLLIMHIECDYRDIDGSFAPQKSWVAKTIAGIYNDLERAAADRG